MYLIDTNIFLEILLEQEKSEVCEQLLLKIKKSNELFYISSFTLHSIEVILIRENKENLLIEFLKYVLTSRIRLITTNIEEELNIINLAKEFNLDFDDAFQFYLCRKNNLKIISYDAHFDPIPITKVDPAEILDII
ncbi:VapC toxin family PIN domain ribonuclease [Candidatus Pacearchaeota archaeon]|nr:VapC toxin family PIN domain ribonuclease [Candidatus Pacearchaeota archaeon]|tara:strand:- start:1091 stop:1498 length:408 start_codon:yes stop_codon:yes gene_type:complete